MPGATNDGFTVRGPYYTTAAGADAAARRRAQDESPTRTTTGVPFARGLHRALEGGKAFGHCPGNIDYVVVEYSEQEVERLQQAGMRAFVPREYDRATEHTNAASLATNGSSLRSFHEHYANEHRSRARVVETQLTLYGLRKTLPLDCSEPATSSERDSRHSEAR